MIFWRREEDPNLQQVKEAIKTWLTAFLESYNAVEVRVAVKRESIEALGKAQSKPDMAAFSAKLVQLVIATLASKEWRLHSPVRVATASQIASRAVGAGDVVLDLTADGIAPALASALERVGVKLDKLPEWLKDFQLNWSDFYQLADVGGARILAESPTGTRYEVIIEAMWFARSLGASIKFKKKRKE